MNRTFIVLISITTATLAVLLLALYILRSKPTSNSVIDQNPAPTAIPIVRNSNVAKTNLATSTLSPEQKSALPVIERSLPYSSDSLAIDYSSLTNKIYVEKKNEKADLEFQKFLIDNGLEEIYKSHPDLFIISPSELSSYITDAEQKLEFSPEEDAPKQAQSPTPTPNHTETYAEKRNQNQYQAFNELTRSIFSFNSFFPTSAPQKPLPNLFAPPANNPTAQNPSQPTTLIGGKDTTNIPCAAGTDYGPADGYTNGVLTRIRVCRIAGMVVNSQVSKQVNDMHAAWVAAGIPLSGGSFRTMSGQITIYQSWCARDGIAGSPPPYPKAPGQTIRCPGGGAPGYSNHQMGMAIDFNCDGSLIPRSYSAASKNKCFQWLSANAGKFGFFEYGYGKTRDGSTGYEGWHWSVNGN